MDEKEKLEKAKKYVNEFKHYCPKLKPDYTDRQKACDQAFNCIYRASKENEISYKTAFADIITLCGNRECGTAISKLRNIEDNLEKHISNAEEGK